MLCHKALIQLLWVLADEVLGQSLQQPGSLFGSLYSALQPVVSAYPSWTAASQVLRQLRSSDGGRSTSHAAVQLQKQLQSLHLGQLLLRLDAKSLVGAVVLSGTPSSRLRMTCYCAILLSRTSEATHPPQGPAPLGLPHSLPSALQG